MGQTCVVPADVTEVVAKLIAAAPTIGPAWRQYLDSWHGEEDRGEYNDIGVVARHLVQLVADGEDFEPRSIFDVVEEIYATNPSGEVSGLLTVGLIEDIQNITSWATSPVGSSAFLPFLGPFTTDAWYDLHRGWGTTDT